MARFLSSGISNFQLTAVVVCFLSHCTVFIESKEYCDAKNPAVMRAYENACSEEFVFCVPGIGGIPATCPKKFVFNHEREICDVPGECGKKFDGKCIKQPCGLYPDPGCETYYICTGGIQVRKKCPKGTFFDTNDKECQDPDEKDVKCGDDVQEASNIVKDIQIDTTFETSDTKFCKYHDFKATETASETENGIILESPKVTDYGEWNGWVECPKGMYFTGISIWKSSIQSARTGAFDHGGVVSLGFKCENPLDMKKLQGNSSITTIGQYAKNSPNDKWYGFLDCDDGAAVGFQLSQQKEQGVNGDDTGTDNVGMYCSAGEQKKAKPYHLKEEMYRKVGYQQGDWTEAKYCREKQALCGLKTQTQDWIESNTVNLRKVDMTGMNQVHMKCCNVPPPSAGCVAKENHRYIQTCDNSQNKNKMGSCSIDILIGVAYNKELTNSVCFYTSIGYKLVDILPDLKDTITTGKAQCKGKCLVDYKNMDAKQIFRIGKMDTGYVTTPKSSVLKVSQVIIKCGIFKIYTNTLIAKNTETELVSKQDSSSNLKFVDME